MQTMACLCLCGAVQCVASASRSHLKGLASTCMVLTHMHSIICSQLRIWPHTSRQACTPLATSAKATRRICVRTFAHIQTRSLIRAEGRRTAQAMCAPDDWIGRHAHFELVCVRAVWVIQCHSIELSPRQHRGVRTANRCQGDDALCQGPHAVGAA
jgi:hypothetical protein